MSSYVTSSHAFPAFWSFRILQSKRLTAYFIFVLHYDFFFLEKERNSSIDPSNFIYSIGKNCAKKNKRSLFFYIFKLKREETKPEFH